MVLPQAASRGILGLGGIAPELGRPTIVARVPSPGVPRQTVHWLFETESQGFRPSLSQSSVRSVPRRTAP